jgi:2-polyprenyl-6-methoxyphenol hydroxylase-like FAD-dependent oxidoreductase
VEAARHLWLAAAMAGARCIVVGAGPGGLAAALALRRAGLDPTVYERQSALTDAGSGLTLWPNAMRALDQLGAADAVREVSAPAHGIAIRAASGKVLDATGPELMLRRFGGGGAALRRAELQDVLADALGRDRIRLGASITEVRPNDSGVTAVFDDGSAMSAALLVGADGIRSTVRHSVVGHVPLRYAGYTVWRAVIEAELSGAVGSLSMGRGAQFGLFPMRAGRVYWFASLNLPERTGEHARGSAGRDRLLNAFARWHEPVPRILAATAPETIVATPIHDAAPLASRAVGRVALVGDAAHPAAPALGQGACQAIEDAAVLGCCLQRGGSVAAALRDYERRRVERTNAMTRQARQMGAIGQWEGRVACWLRDSLIAHTPERLRVRRLEWMFDFEPGDARG